MVLPATAGDRVAVRLAVPPYVPVAALTVKVVGVVRGLSAIKIPPFRCAAESVAVPAPVAPAVAFVAHAAPTDAWLA